MIGFLHTAQVHVATFDALVHDAGPDVGPVRHVVREALLDDVRRDGWTPAARAGLADALAELADADVIVCTCSTLGPVAEGPGVLRVDRPLARAAVTAGRRIAVVTAVESTLEPTLALIAQEAAAAGVEPVVRSVHVPGAWPLFEAGDLDGYRDVLVAAVGEVAREVDVVVLAQASMLAAADALSHLDVPVLASPRLAVATALKAVG